jgi:hypothetical protein
VLPLVGKKSENLCLYHKAAPGLIRLIYLYVLYAARLIRKTI